MIKQMLQLVELFAAHAEDRSTLEELHRMISDDRSWPQAHDLFRRIRRKTLDSDDQADPKTSAQCLFEEFCAKTLFNLTDTDRPFDEDAPYWVVPSALSLARCLGIDEAKVVRIVAA